MQGCARFLLLLALLAAFLLGAAYWLLAQPPTERTAVTPVIVSTAAAQRFDDKVATVQGATAPVTVEITSQELTSKLVEALAADPTAPRIDNPQVTFQEGKIHFTGTTRDTPLPVSFRIVGRLEARDGLLVAVVEEVDTGRVPLPGPVKDQLISGATDLTALNRDLRVHVTEVRVVGDRLALSGRPK